MNGLKTLAAIVVLELFPNLVFLVGESKNSSDISAIISYMSYNFSAPSISKKFRYLRMAFQEFPMGPFPIALCNQATWKPPFAVAIAASVMDHPTAYNVWGGWISRSGLGWVGSGGSSFRERCRGSRGDFRGDFRSEAVHAVLHVLLQQGVSSTDRSTW